MRMSAPHLRRYELLSSYLRPQRLKVALLTVLLLSSIGLQLLSPQILRHFIDTATGAASNADALRELLRLGAIFIGVTLIAQLVTVGATYLSEQVGWTATNLLRGHLARHCLKLDMTFHNLRTPGELIERIDGDVSALSTFFSKFVIQVFGSGLLLIGVLVVLFNEDARVGAALALFTLVALVVLGRSRNMAVSSMREDREARARLASFLEERLAGLDDLRANGGGSYVMQRLYLTMRQLTTKGHAAAMMSARLWIITTGLFVLGYALALSIGAYLFNAGLISIGTVYLFFQYTTLLRRPLEQIADQLKEFQQASASISRVQELLSVEPTIVDGGATQPPQQTALPSGPLSVEFERVTFGYDDDQPVLDALTFRLEPGTVLGLLGRTGSGKTTLTRLLFRLYDPRTGTIRLGGADIRGAQLADLRQQIGIVTQDVQLFHASVRDNLSLFDSSVPDERILEALHDLGLGEWYAGLSQGLDTQLTGSGGLSAGEAQLLAFARVFLKDPGLVVLDEASSRLDPATERLIEHAIDKLLRPGTTRRTAIIIAHRLATVQRADEIMIVERGRVLEHGPRARLAADPQSRFAQLLQVGMEEVLA